MFSRPQLPTYLLQKVMQYGLKVYLLFHASVGSSRFLAHRAKTPWETDLVRRLESTVSGVSLTRYAPCRNIAAKPIAVNPDSYAENF
jgi:hypothetical protein